VPLGDWAFWLVRRPVVRYASLPRILFSYLDDLRGAEAPLFHGGVSGSADDARCASGAGDPIAAIFATCGRKVPRADFAAAQDDEGTGSG